MAAQLLGSHAPFLPAASSRWVVVSRSGSALVVVPCGNVEQVVCEHHRVLVEVRAVVLVELLGECPRVMVVLHAVMEGECPRLLVRGVQVIVEQDFREWPRA